MIEENKRLNSNEFNPDNITRNIINNSPRFNKDNDYTSNINPNKIKTYIQLPMSTILIKLILQTYN